MCRYILCLGLPHHGLRITDKIFKSVPFDEYKVILEENKSFLEAMQSPDMFLARKALSQIESTCTQDQSLLLIKGMLLSLIETYFPFVNGHCGNSPRSVRPVSSVAARVLWSKSKMLLRSKRALIGVGFSRVW